MPRRESSSGKSVLLALCLCLVFTGCCSVPKPSEPVIDDLQQQQTASAVIVERIEVETERLVHDLQIIQAPPEVIERATVIVKDAVELKASLEKERIMTSDLRVRVADLVAERYELETDRNRVRGQRNIAFLVISGILAIAALAFWLK